MANDQLLEALIRVVNLIAARLKTEPEVLCYLLRP